MMTSHPRNVNNLNDNFFNTLTTFYLHTHISPFCMPFNTSLDNISPIPGSIQPFLTTQPSSPYNPHRNAHEVEDLFQKLSIAYWVLALNICIHNPLESLRYAQLLLNILGQLKENDVDIANALLCKKLALKKLGGNGNTSMAEPRSNPNFTLTRTQPSPRHSPKPNLVPTPPNPHINPTLLLTLPSWGGGRGSERLQTVSCESFAHIHQDDRRVVCPHRDPLVQWLLCRCRTMRTGDLRRYDFLTEYSYIQLAYTHISKWLTD